MNLGFCSKVVLLCGSVFASILMMGCPEHVGADPDAGDGGPESGMDADDDADADADVDGDSDSDGHRDGDSPDAESDIDIDIEICGDEICAADENAESCPLDCEAFCSDGASTHRENASSCPEDCPMVDGDGACTHTESYSEWSDSIGANESGRTKRSPRSPSCSHRSKRTRARTHRAMTAGAER